jgi:hypothetical protein
MSIQQNILTGFVACLLTFAGTTQAAEKTNANFKNGYPSAKFSKSATDEQDFQRALTAYRFWYPTVSTESIFVGGRDLGCKDNEGFSILSAQPHHNGFTLNSDTPYGGGAVDLSNGPMVIEVPPGPYIGLADDHHQRWIFDMGLPGPDKEKGGKHLLLPPNYKGDIPKGYQVGRSATNKVLVAIRALPITGDMDAALKSLNNIKIYSLSNPTKSVKMIDITNKKMDGSILRWEDNLQFWSVLHKVLAEEPMTDDFSPMYGLLVSLGISKDKPFNPDARMKAILERAAKAGRDQMLVAAFGSTAPERLAWDDRKWEWASFISDNGNFMSAGGMDLQSRDRWFAQAIVASPAMFRRATGAGSLYWLGLRDTTGNFLDGGKTYQLKVPYPVPENLFWSVTVYDAATRSEVQTDQNKAALRSLFELKGIPKGSTDVTLYFGPKAPAGKENLWIKTTAGRGWFSYFRIYGPTTAAFDGSWKPHDFEAITPAAASKQIGMAD